MLGDQSNSERHCSSHARFSLGKFEGPGKLDADKAGQVQVQPEPNAIEADEPKKEPEEDIRAKTILVSHVDSSVLDKSSTALCFNLHGYPISPADSLKLSTHLRLHHHAAECTLDNIFLLSRSTV
ncbi:hypothetical protein CPC08DRAFT_755069 [Agrocybe pediades]|nr:hypothetical protein CPC08DRAFT_755069 [Agrocybe pediades]